MSVADTMNTSNYNMIPPSVQQARADIPAVNNTETSTSSFSTSNSLIFGLPEKISGKLLGADFSINENMNSVILELIPGKLKYDGASENIINAWKFVDETGKWEGYLAKVLQDAGIQGLVDKMPSAPTKFALQDFTANESLQSEYGDSFLQSVNDMGANVVRDFAYLSNGNMDNFKSMITNNMNGMGLDGDSIMSGLSSAGDVAKSGLSSLGIDADKIMGGATGKLLEGYRVDLPKIWKNTHNIKNYTCKIKLSASVDNPKAIVNRVLLPYAAILTYASAQSDESYLYKWPFVVKAYTPGYFEIPAGAITDVQISKPGEDRIISNRGKYLNIDITLTIMPVYSTQFLLSPGAAIPESMLTVSKELKSISRRLAFDEGL